MTSGPVPGTRMLAGRCPYCRREVYQVRDLATGRLVFLEHEVVRGLELLGPNDPPATVRGYTAEGKAARVNPEAAAAGPQLEVYRLHATVCFRAARSTGQPAPAPEQGTCRGCGAPMLWVRTVDGKRVPLDPAPHTGPLVANGEPVPQGFHLVRGYTLDGAVRAILEGSATGLFQEPPKGDQATLYVSHFATCPERDSFKRGASGARRGARGT